MFTEGNQDARINNEDDEKMRANKSREFNQITKTSLLSHLKLKYLALLLILTRNIINL